MYNCIFLNAWCYNCSSLNSGIVGSSSWRLKRRAATSCRLFVCTYLNVCVCASVYRRMYTYYYFYYYHYYNIGGETSRRVCARTRILLTPKHTRTHILYTYTSARPLHRTETTSLEYFNSL